MASALVKYSDCLIGMGLLFTTLAGGVLGNIGNGIPDANELILQLGTTVPTQATFYINYIVTGAFIGLMMEISMIVPLVLSYIPGAQHVPFDYYKKYAVSIMMFTVVTTFAVIAPFILLWGAIYFGLAWFCFTYQLFYVYKP